jgi:hypothetical protein
MVNLLLMLMYAQSAIRNLGNIIEMENIASL